MQNPTLPQGPTHPFVFRRGEDTGGGKGRGGGGGLAEEGGRSWGGGFSGTGQIRPGQLAPECGEGGGMDTELLAQRWGRTVGHQIVLVGAKDLRSGGVELPCNPLVECCGDGMPTLKVSSAKHPGS